MTVIQCTLRGSAAFIQLPFLSTPSLWHLNLLPGALAIDVISVVPAKFHLLEATAEAARI